MKLTSVQALVVVDSTPVYNRSTNNNNHRSLLGSSDSATRRRTRKLCGIDMRKKKRSSPSNPLALQIKGRPGINEGKEPTRELQIVDPTSTIFEKLPFKLPRGWSVVERPRLNCPSHPGRVDKYYFEPGTGRQFRSLTAIQRYLSGDTEDAIVPRRMKSVNEEYMQLVPRSTKSASSFGLPDNWIVEERPRNNINYCGTVDRYFIEPENGLRFRSRIAAERYLKEVSRSTSTTKGKPSNQLIKKDISDENCSLRTYLKYLTDARKIKTTLEAVQPGNCSTEKHISDNEDINARTLDSPHPPAKVKWVLGGPGGNIWNPLIDEALVSESEKQEWSEKFVFYIHERY